MTLDELRRLVGPDRRWPEPLGKMAPTLDEAEFLHALVRSAKPALVWESGTGLGVSARFIAEALQLNGKGKLVTYEPSRAFASQAERLLPAGYAQIEIGTLPAVSRAPDIVHIDSEPGVRASEIRRWLRSKYPGLVVVHDANRDYDGFRFGCGVLIPTADGIWVGRAGR